MRGKDVTLEGVSITYPNGFTAVKPTSLRIEAGEFFSILGPSGCGKTTILRAVSGFNEPSEGRILIGGEDMAGRGPNARPTALIFQNLALFPLMPVWENVAFGLEARGIGILNATPTGPARIVAIVDLDRPERDRLPHTRQVDLLGVALPLLNMGGAPHLAAAPLQYLKAGRRDDI